ncbi:hypothetical protein QOT17_003942 [Balamuthia mandrillaris]
MALARGRVLLLYPLFMVICVTAFNSVDVASDYKGWFEGSREVLVSAFLDEFYFGWKGYTIEHHEENYYYTHESVQSTQLAGTGKMALAFSVMALVANVTGGVLLIFGIAWPKDVAHRARFRKISLVFIAFACVFSFIASVGFISLFASEFDDELVPGIDHWWPSQAWFLVFFAFVFDFFGFSGTMGCGYWDRDFDDPQTVRRNLWAPVSPT